ncbi:GGDEF domain-containing protein [Desulforamulus ruminis]|uniref:GGDEF domain-containing protein n=1 Tax=Desulforamulus ruminis TaxID=1564 RepID=UPI002FDB63AC
MKSLLTSPKRGVMPITTKVKILTLFFGTLPVAIMLVVGYDSSLYQEPDFNKAMALALAMTILIALFSSKLIARWMVSKQLGEIKNFCGQVKKGDYGVYFNLPSEHSEGQEENEVISLMRDMNWMVHQISIRESKLQEMILEMESAQQELYEQRQALETANRELLTMQHQLRESNQELNQAFLKMQDMAMTDPLTQLPNRRFFFTFMEQELSRVSRYNEAIALIMIDIDHFKKINDGYGHQAGDQVLQELAAILKNRKRASDVAARMGGEEFALVLPHTQLAAAVSLAVDLHELIQEHIFLRDSDAPISVTASFGLCVFSGSPYPDIDEIYQCADQTLYASKNAGRNSIHYYDRTSGHSVKVA